MDTSALVFALFTGFSALRTVSYIPQIMRISRDPNGATAISYSTWTLWTGANLSTCLYALVTLSDAWLAFVSAIYACCCLTVIAITFVKRRRAWSSLSSPTRATLGMPAVQQPR